MKSVNKFLILQNIEIAPGIYDMVLEGGEAAAEAQPGQFMGLYTRDSAHLLPRPISVCDSCNGTLRLVYQVTGNGTRIFSEMKKGDCIKALGPLGNGFTTGPGVVSCALAGGGIGIPPLLFLCKVLARKTPKADVHVYLGYRSEASRLFLSGDFEKAGARVYIATEDGSAGFHGNITELLKERDHCSACYGCGPRPMLRALTEWAGEKGVPCQISMEERMACCLGACLGCPVKTRDGDRPGGFIYRKACSDGPVFPAEAVIWE